MGVPNNSTFSLQDITTEIYGDTNSSRNLNSCFNDGDGVFDNSHNVSGSEQMVEFQNYSHVNLLLLNDSDGSYDGDDANLVANSYARVTNSSVNGQTITHNWKFMSAKLLDGTDANGGSSDYTVYPPGTTSGQSKDPGYITSPVSSTLNTSGLDVTNPFSITNFTSDTIVFTFRFLIVSATTDNIDSNIDEGDVRVTV